MVERSPAVIILVPKSQVGHPLFEIKNMRSHVKKGSMSGKNHTYIAIETKKVLRTFFSLRKMCSTVVGKRIGLISGTSELTHSEKIRLSVEDIVNICSFYFKVQWEGNERYYSNYRCTNICKECFNRCSDIASMVVDFLKYPLHGQKQDYGSAEVLLYSILKKANSLESKEDDLLDLVDFGQLKIRKMKPPPRRVITSLSYDCTCGFLKE